jgi:hypothetical protein
MQIFVDLRPFYEIDQMLLLSGLRIRGFHAEEAAESDLTATSLHSLPGLSGSLAYASTFQ